MPDTNARVSQELIEALGPDAAHARVDQETIEVLGPVPSTARVSQEYVEVLGPYTAYARLTQEYVEVLGPPASSGTDARVTQEYVEVLGYPIDETPCHLPAPLNFYGNVTGLFYPMKRMGAETVPVALADSFVTVVYGSNITVAQNLTVEETWVEWSPASGALKINFSSGNPVRTVWVVTNQIRATPPVVWIWASAFRFDLWKQECIP